jgi:hypothetical protein
MEQPIKPLDVVALTTDIPDKSLVRGQVGTVVEELAPGVYEVEFSDMNTGHTIAMLPVKSEHLLMLRYTPTPV